MTSRRIAFHYLGLMISLPAGLAMVMVIATVCGGVVVGVAGGARIVQLRRDPRRSNKSFPNLA